MLGIPAEALPWEQFWRNRISQEIAEQFIETRYSPYMDDDVKVVLQFQDITNVIDAVKKRPLI